MNRKAQVAFEFIILVVFGFVLISLIMYGVGMLIVDLNRQQSEQTIDDVAQSILDEFELAQDIDEGYEREVTIEPHVMERFNITINKSSGYLILQDLEGPNPDEQHYYYIEGLTNFTFSTNETTNEGELVIGKGSSPQYRGLDEDELNYAEVPIEKSYFVTKWNTSLAGSSNNNQITLPLTFQGSYDFTVNWGDGSNDTITQWNQPEVTHSYSSPGVYEINITGEIVGWRFNNNGDKGKIIEIKNWGPLRLGNQGRYFYGTSNLKITAADVLDTSGMSNFNYMFKDSSSITLIPNISQWNKSSVTTMKGLFQGATKFNQSLNNWDVGSVEDMSFMFNNAASFNQPLNNWDVGSVEDMSFMLSGADSFNQPLDNWDISSVTNMQSMFRGTQSFNQQLNDWGDSLSSVENMAFMFANTNSFNQPLNNWNTSNVENMAYMFFQADGFNKSLNSWDVGSVEDMSFMFFHTDSFNKPLNDWNTSSVTTMHMMFNSANSFNQPLNDWNTSNVTEMSRMFQFTPYNEPLNNWDTSSVKTMRRMFANTNSFNQPLNNWSVDSVEDMSFMFRQADSFNQPLNEWNTSNVENMAYMFRLADSFNQSLNNWNVSNVDIMKSMFREADSFSKDISSWCVEQIENKPLNFDLSSGFENESQLQPNWGELCGSKPQTTLTLTSDQTNINLRTIFDNRKTGVPSDYSQITFEIQNGVTIGSTSVSNPSLTVGNWPAETTLLLNNYGRIQGAGGKGGDIQSQVYDGEDGEDGGDAFYTRGSIEIDNQGSIIGGAGGGGAGGSASSSRNGGALRSGASGGSGGGGAGYNPGLGGSASSQTLSGEDGTQNYGGAGGTGGSQDISFGGDGGAGGNPGQPGEDGQDGSGNVQQGTGGAGGAAGNYANGESYITWISTGDLKGNSIN